MGARGVVRRQTAQCSYDLWCLYKTRLLAGKVEESNLFVSAAGDDGVAVVIIVVYISRYYLILLVR